MTNHGSGDGDRMAGRSPLKWIRSRVGLASERITDEVPFDLRRGFDLDHWLAATGGIPAGLIDRTRHRTNDHLTLRDRPVMSMTIALLIVSAGFVAAANLSMPTGAVGEPSNPAAAVPTETADGDGGSDGDAAAPATSTATATATSTSTATATATATPTATPTETESDPVDDLVETVDDTVDSTEDSVNETVNSTL